MNRLLSQVRCISYIPLLSLFLLSGCGGGVNETTNDTVLLNKSDLIATVRGEVHLADSTIPIPNASIKIGKDITIVTNNDGVFTANLSTGSDNAIISADHFIDQKVQLNISSLNYTFDEPLYIYYDPWEEIAMPDTPSDIEYRHRSWNTIGIVGSKIYFDAHNQHFYSYDLTNSTYADLPTNTVGYAGTHFVHAANRLIGFAYSSSAEYNFESSTWAPVDAKPLEARYPGYVTNNTLVYAVGGRDASNLAQKTVQIYDPSGTSPNKWQQKSDWDFFYNIYQPTTVMHKDKVYVLGGSIERIIGSHEQKMSAFNTTGAPATWSALPDLPFKVSQNQPVALLKDTLLVRGSNLTPGDNFTTFDPNTKLYRYDFTRGEWNASYGWTQGGQLLSNGTELYRVTNDYYTGVHIFKYVEYTP